MRDEKAEFSERLRAAMRALQWPPRPTVLEKKFNTHYEGRSVSFQTVSAWLGGRSIPQQDKLRVLADLLDVEPQHLRFGSPTSSKAGGKRAVEWPGTLSDQDRVAVKALLALPARRRRLVRELIDALGRDGTDDS